MANALANLLAKKKAEAATASDVTQTEPRRTGGASQAETEKPSIESIESTVSSDLSSSSEDSTPQSPSAQDQVKAEESSTEVKPVASPLAKRLLTTPKPPPAKPNVMDSVAVAKIIKPELTVESLANSDGTIDDPHAGDRFKMTLDLLDAKLNEIGGRLDTFSIDIVRSMVSRIMIDLKEHPDYDGLYLGDRDVHNIMAFMYRVKDMAIESNAKKATKAVEKSKKSAQKINFGAALDQLSIGDLSL